MRQHFPRPKSYPLTEDQVRARAYELWKARGSVGGSPDEDWQTAIEELKLEHMPLRRLNKRLQTAFDTNNRDFTLEVFKTFISTLGLAATILAGLGLYLTYKSGQEQQRIAQEQQQLDSERLVTERLAKAVEQLGSQDMNVRIGGIYSLERIAKDSSKDYPIIMEILTAFVRNKSPVQLNFDNKIQRTSRITTDIQSAVTVIGRCCSNIELQRQALNLMNTNLKGAFLESANLQGINFEGTNLQGAQMKGANLQGARLVRTNLQGAQMTRTNLKDAKMVKVYLENATLNEANLEKVDLNRAKLKSAKLDGANLQNVNFEAADLQETNLGNAKLQGANFLKSNLQGAVLRSAKLRGAQFTGVNLKNANLEGVNFRDTIIDVTTKTKITQAKLCRTTMPDGKLSDRDCKELGLP